MTKDTKKDRELLGLVRRVSADIAKMGLAKGETQKICNANSKEFIEVYSNSYSSLNFR